MLRVCWDVEHSNCFFQTSRHTMWTPVAIQVKFRSSRAHFVLLMIAMIQCGLKLLDVRHAWQLFLSRSARYAKFLQFYNSFYTPANARVWMYGDNDELERLAFLDSRLNHAWQARQPATEVSKAPCTTPESAVAVGAQSAIPFQSLKHIAQWHRFPCVA